MNNEQNQLVKEMISDRLCILRYKWGITQEAAAKNCGLQPSAISHFETGRRVPSAANIIKLVWGYRTSADYILGIAPRDKPFPLPDMFT